MNQRQVLVQHLSNINSVIKHPLKLTQRIKFTCFDVSQNYIVFGATSGGLYIFNRYPHVFIKLIPSKQGSAVQVAISPNEKTVVLGSSRGLIIVIENCFTETNVQYQVYTEHEGSTITTIKWHIDDVYCGDNKGKISVITLPNLLTKAIFQTPCASLMHLDSLVVQIECYSKFLLISTYTRTYICDTDKEQYRQIGKKLRDGCFGACFLANDNCEASSVHASTSRGLFKKVKDDEQFAAIANDNVKIFCARPGARMWEAKLDASVTRTHQFKNFLKQKATSIVHLDDELDAHLRIINFSESESKASELFNFTKVFLLNSKFIFTFNREGFYVFNPDTVALICWCNYFTNIKDVKILKNFVYIWNENAELHVIALYDLEKIILKTLFNKQYYLSSELCINYMEDVLQLVETSEKIHLVSILKDKLTEVQAQDLLKTLTPLLKAIQDFSDQACAGQRLTTGIVVVNNSYMDRDAVCDEIKYEKDQQLAETFQSLKEIGFNVTDKLSERTKHFKEKLQILEATVKNLTLNDAQTFSDATSTINSNATAIVKEDPFLFEENAEIEAIVERKIHSRSAEMEAVLEIDPNLKIFHQLYELTKINPNIEIPKFNKIFLTNSLNHLVGLCQDFEEYMLEKDADQTHIKLWCYKHYLKQLSKRNFEAEIKNLKLEDPAIHFLSTAFRAINFSAQHSCACLFPLPSARTKHPYYYDIGCAILKQFKLNKLESFEELQKEVPYMWKCIIENWKNDHDINIMLPLLIQFGEEDLLAKFLDKFKYDTWDNAVQLVIKIKNKTCVNCDNNFENSCDVLNWTNFATLMVQSIGGPSTINLLIRYANFIPSHELNGDFYQSCIFATAIDNFQGELRSKAVNFTKNMLSDDSTAVEFNQMMVKFLQNKYETKPTPRYSRNGLVDVKKTDLNCSSCDLPVHIPLINGDVKLECHHLFHKICLQYNKNICMKCKE